MSAQVRSIGSMLLLLAGPLVWAAHFFALYLTESFGCDGVNKEIVRAVGAGYTLLALTVVAWTAWVFGRSRPQEYGNVSLAARFALPLVLLSGVAIVWAALPVILLSPCTVAIG